MYRDRKVIVVMPAYNAAETVRRTHREVMQQDCVDEVRTLSDGGPQLILEMLANVNLAADLDLVAKYGRIVVIGNRGEVTINPRMTMMKELDVRGLALFNGSRAQMETLTADLLSGLADGSLRPVIGREVPLAEAGAGHKAVLAPGAHGKIVLVP